MKNTVLKIILLMALFGIEGSKSFGADSRYMELADTIDCLISCKDWNQAELKIKEALSLEPANFNNSLLLSNLGIIQINKEEFDRAIESFTLGLSISPSSTTLHNNRARAYLLMDKLSEALGDINESLRIDSVQEWPLLTGGLLYIKINEEFKAEQILRKLQKEFPNNPISYSGQATIQVRRGNVDKAISLYRQALEKNPEDEEILCSYIYLLIETEKYNEARTELRKAIEKNPENGMFYLLRGYIHYLNHLLNEAEADKKTSIEKGIELSYASEFIP